MLVSKMKKLLIVLSMLIAAGPVLAQHRHPHSPVPYYQIQQHHHYHYHNRYGWVAPIVTGVIGYELGRRSVEVPPPPIVIQQPIPVHPPVGYSMMYVYNPICVCYKYIMVRN